MTVRNTVLALIAAFLFTGCVSSTKYDALMAESGTKDETIDNMLLEIDTSKTLHTYLCR